MVKRIIMEELKIKLALLKEKENQLKRIIDRSFSSEEEFNSFIEENNTIIIELKGIKNEIKDIEWQLMTDEEKEVHVQYLIDLKEKFKDEK
jgi:hypothetical protein